LGALGVAALVAASPLCLKFFVRASLTFTGDASLTVTGLRKRISRHSPATPPTKVKTLPANNLSTAIRVKAANRTLAVAA
jgi:hypothetical protein